MRQLTKMAAVLAVLSLHPFTQAFAASQPQLTMQTDSGQGSPFGYERQMKKMMRPINDLLPQGSNEEALPVRE
ncbi:MULTISPECIES: hypothetical protein [Erwinia]|uniref:Uncharacterized protein n=1 Tax=Erwinia rhapontici TaxID=55212 RepID=A0ABN6DDK5_ERWRD|nr:MULTISPECIES: hypothetical protein [Erwinia]MBP2153585.1 hypothetical protein [Erwinia rhapontici]MCS3608652.1 hypothetical protein [Erwinia rhapontici]NKG31233.1 hypothetical protein [Erwinia rhapontici]NNS08886.1 hypothetical protein [Erwinia sp. JH02]TDS98757.1 hypothetical protein EDF84_10593 [Erwinia rhapontici]